MSLGPHRCLCRSFLATSGFEACLQFLLVLGLMLLVWSTRFLSGCSDAQGSHRPLVDLLDNPDCWSHCQRHPDQGQVLCISAR